MVLKTLDSITSMNSSNVSNVSNFKPKCFLWWNLLNWAAVKTIGACTTFLILRVKITPRTYFRSSRQAVFCKEGVLRNLQENTCARVSLLIKLRASIIHRFIKLLEFRLLYNIIFKYLIFYDWILDFRIYLRQNLVTKDLCFIGNEITNNIDNFFDKIGKFFVDRAFLKKCSLPVERSKFFLIWAVFKKRQIGFPYGEDSKISIKIHKSSVTRQTCESQNGCYEKIKHV